MKKILLGLTTTPGSDWREKCREIDKFGLEEIALFPTFLRPDERKELCNLLKNTTLKSIPHVHLRDDMTEDEIMFFCDNYGTKLFNIHPDKAGEIVAKRLKQLNIPVYIENTGYLQPNFEKRVMESDGICVDFAHFDDHWYICKEEGYKIFAEIMEKYPIGCCHVSAVGKTKTVDLINDCRLSRHYFETVDDLDYMKKFIKYLPEFVSLELENSFEEQLQAKAYLERLITE